MKRKFKKKDPNLNLSRGEFVAASILLFAAVFLFAAIVLLSIKHG